MVIVTFAICSSNIVCQWLTSLAIKVVIFAWVA